MPTKRRSPIRPPLAKQAPKRGQSESPRQGALRKSVRDKIEPQRLNKLLAQSGLGSRRDMEALIEAGRVTVNGKVAVLGSKAGPNDDVRVSGRKVQLRFDSPRKVRILFYHKPEGEIVSREDPEGRPSVFDHLPLLRNAKWHAIGRLDFNTSGLLIFTTSGELANRLMHPRYEMEREYAVRLRGELSPDQETLLKTGVPLEDGPAHFDTLRDLGGEGSNHWYRVVLKEGRNREVRRMFESIGLTVSRLIRVRFGAISLPGRLKRGRWMELEPDEVEKLIEWANKPVEQQPEPAETRVPRRPSTRPDKPVAKPRAVTAKTPRLPGSKVPRHADKPRAAAPRAAKTGRSNRGSK